MSSSPDHRNAPLPLWRAASALITTLFNLFGAPEELAAKHTLTTPTYRLILNWLRCAEALVRHLIFIEAAAHPKSEAPPLSRTQRQRKRRVVEFDIAKPEDWRVSFRCVAFSTLRQAQGDAVCGAHGPVSVSLSLSKAERPPIGFHSAWPLAERFEGLLRAHNDPAPYARRLARHLHATPRIIAKVLRVPAELAHRIGEDVFAAVRVACGERKPIFDST